MPELPEVEVVRRKLTPALLGRTISEVHTTAPSYFFLTPPAELRQHLRGRRVTALVRFGKYLVAELDDATRLLLHLGMTGQLFTEHADNPRLVRKAAQLSAEQRRGFTRDAHTHLQLDFSDGAPSVYFRDARKFGKVRWLAAGQSDERLEKLGPDALVATGEMLRAAAQRRTAPIKSVLLDQSVLAGCGNIYADEALFATGIRPTRRANKVTLDQCHRLVAELQKVLLRAIETGGSSMSDYVSPDGSDGSYQKERRVYAREGEACHVCQTTIKRIVIGQRSAHYCPVCQR